MAITSLQLIDFRNFAKTAIKPCLQGLNIISGNNGSGKTSILEAIHYLGHGRSFRSSTLSPLVRHEAEKFSLYSQLVTQSNRDICVGAERATSGSSRFKVDDKDINGVTELAALMPIRVIDSHSHQLFEAGPAFRRKYLDWGLFYQSPAFFDIWRDFERSLKQRNSLLRDRRSKTEIDPWSMELVKHGLLLDAERRQYVAQLAPYLSEVASVLLPFESVELAYEPGWDDSTDLESIMVDSFYQDHRIGHTQHGPHRAELAVTLSGVLAKQILSRGQQKLLICAMILAQGIMLAKCVNKRLIYLIDDLPSELDAISRKKLINLLISQQTQVFITAIEYASICDFIDGNAGVPVKVFHVEHDVIQELVGPLGVV
jgi:DNA replication and repair protein RecF